MRTNIVARLALAWLCVAFNPAFASDAPAVAIDPVLEKRVQAVAEELRCLVCQNQTIADSHAELAVDLKNQVREMLQQGKSETAIKQFMVERYGDFVLYRPQVKGSTWLLWGGPFVLLLVALSFLLFKLRQRNRQVAALGNDMTEEAREKVERLLGVTEAPLTPQKESNKDKA